MTRSAVALLTVVLLSAPILAQDTPVSTGWPQPADTATSEKPVATGWPTDATTPPPASPGDEQPPAATQPPTPTVVTNETAEKPSETPPTVPVNNQQQDTVGATKMRSGEPEPREVKGFSRATVEMQCSVSGQSLKGKFYKIFRSQPMTALSYEATTMVLKRTKEFREIFWKTYNHILKKDYQAAVNTALDEIKLIDIIEENGQFKADEKSLADYTAPQGRLRRDYTDNLSRAIGDVDRFLKNNDYSRLCKTEEKESLELLLRKLSERVIQCAAADKSLVDGTLIPDGTQIADSTQAYLVTRLLLDYLVSRVHECQNYLSPPITSSPTIRQVIVANLRKKAVAGPSSIIEDRHLVAPIVGNTVKALLTVILILILIPGCLFYMLKNTAETSDEPTESVEEPVAEAKEETEEDTEVEEEDDEEEEEEEEDEEEEEEEETEIEEDDDEEEDEEEAEEDSEPATEAETDKETEPDKKEEDK